MRLRTALVEFCICWGITVFVYANVTQLVDYWLQTFVVAFFVLVLIRTWIVVAARIYLLRVLRSLRRLNISLDLRVTPSLVVFAKKARSAGVTPYKCAVRVFVCVNSMNVMFVPGSKVHENLVGCIHDAIRKRDQSFPDELSRISIGELAATTPESLRSWLRDAAIADAAETWEWA